MVKDNRDFLGKQVRIHVGSGGRFQRRQLENSWMDIHKKKRKEKKRKEKLIRQSQPNQVRRRSPLQMKMKNK